ncbi:hypothetical protein PEX1_036620 [Penicillium expansum]|nr:hypothetical protein PEXP_101610 [Penicillium expansum]KGO65900.1 hypothetical protein PEX1_036620 [Penicillium expansum]
MLEQRWEISRHDGGRAAQRGSGGAVQKPVRGGLCVSIYQQLVKRNPATQGMAGFISLGSLQQRPKEKWACRRNSTNTVILTKGNGGQHAIVIIGDKKGLDIEDTGNRTQCDGCFGLLQFHQDCSFDLAFLWVALLVVAASVKQHFWVLLVIRGIGILENILVAGSLRYPAAFGMPLNFENVIGEAKFMNTLFAVEQAHPQVGRRMLDTFFPGLRPKERDRWDEFGRLADGLDERFILLGLAFASIALQLLHSRATAA